MSIYELIVMVVIVIVLTLVVCGLGTVWLIYDINQQIKKYEETMNKNNKEVYIMKCKIIDLNQYKKYRPIRKTYKN